MIRLFSLEIFIISMIALDLTIEAHIKSFLFEKCSISGASYHTSLAQAWLPAINLFELVVEFQPI